MRLKLASCPECKTENKTPSRIWKVLDDPTKYGMLNERSVGIFQCVRCGTTFPYTVGKRRLSIIDADEYMKLISEMKEIRTENRKLKEDIDIIKLQAEFNALEKEVSALIKEKRELETKLSGYR